jgi:hypothetical protein
MIKGVQDRAGPQGTFRRSIMRGIPLLLLGATLVSCTAAPPDPAVSARAAQRYQELVGGKVAGPAQGCLPLLPTRGDMVVIDDQTVIFKGSGGRVYVNHLSPGCTGVGQGNALVTRQTGSTLCRGDIAQVQNFTSGITVGSCTLGDFIPYGPPGA